MPEESLLVIAEPNLGLIKAACRQVDLKELLQSGRVMVFTSLDRAPLVERLESRCALLLGGTEDYEEMIGNVKLLGHEASLRALPEFHRAFQKLFLEFIAYIRTNLITMRENRITTCRNIANNLGRFGTTPPLDLLQNAFAGRPAVLVAAGPSLQKNMHLLHELKGEGRSGGPGGRRAVIIAVQTMLKPLLAAGIEPDFVTSLDYNTVSTRFFENLEESGSTGLVHLVAQPTANWNVLDVFTGTMSLTDHEFAALLLKGYFPPRASLKGGATVAHLSLYLAEYLGCDPIILTGQDLGFVDGLYYKPGTAIHETWGVELGRFNTLETKEWERIVRSRTILRKIPDIHGHPMYTEEQFFVYLQQFERDFAASRSRIIDATEGGAKKQHVEVMTLRAAIDAFCSATAQPNASARPWKTWSCDVAANLQRVISALEARRASAEAMKETCIQTVPLLEEMLAHQTDTQRMNRLFVEIDRHRSRVGADPSTFELVSQVNSVIAELRKFQGDLLVRKAGQDSLERQKRQLQRDLAYVKDLQAGAERLLELLEEAMARLRRQWEAACSGELWPREVAGSTAAGRDAAASRGKAHG
jgi:hypothetical protein